MALLSKLRRFVVGQKYRFDLGVQFLVFINFALLVLTASDKLKGIISIQLTTGQILLIAVPAAFVGMWVFGYILDQIVQYQHYQELESQKRSPGYKTTQEKLDRIIERLDKLEHFKT